MNSIAVCIITFNQEAFIIKAIESVLAQKFSESYKIFIGEDCSTDSTREICLSYKNKYPENIELVLNVQNLGLVQNTMSLLQKIKESNFKYIAMLDGDDYWIDKDKLQKQYDLLEQNEEIGLVHTNNELLWNEKDIEHKSKINSLKGNVFNNIENFNVANCTVMFRTLLLDYINFEEYMSQGFMSCDYVMYAIFSKYTQFGFLEDFTAVWRRGHISVSNLNDINKDIAYIDNDLRMWKYLGKLFPARFGHSEKEADAWRNFRTFNIAFRYKNYHLANKILKKRNMQERENVTFKIKKIMASNKVFFIIWCVFKK